LNRILSVDPFGTPGKNGTSRNPHYENIKRHLGETTRQETESRESSFTEGGALGSKTGDNGPMDNEKSGRHDRLPQSTRSIGDF
jgi:hypothetical protein